MSFRATTEQALVLKIAPSGESFQRLEVLAKNAGYLLCLKRISKKKPQHITPDLFDTADIQLENSRQGTAHFIKEYHLLQRRERIGQSYRKLHFAAEFCSLIAHNAPHMADPMPLYAITERTLNAFAQRDFPEIIFLKALYCLLRDEGYPVRESWWYQLTTEFRELARKLINEPTPDSASADLIENSKQITESLRNWLSRETDLTVPQVKSS